MSLDDQSVPVELRVPSLDAEEVRSIKALGRGDASELQQKLALQVIIKKLCRSHDLPYVPDRPDASTFLS